MGRSRLASARPSAERSQRRKADALPALLRGDNLVTMTRKTSAGGNLPADGADGRWRLQDAKARFSELVRLAHSKGPQHVTLHGREAVVVVDADEFRRLKGARTGQLLVEALQSSPHRQVDLEPLRSPMAVRTIEL